MTTSRIYLLRSTTLFALKLMRSNTQRRHVLTWLRSLKGDYLLSAPSPWITFDAIDYIKARIRPGWRIFEYGSGGSTLFWLKQGAQCTSIEHDPAWYSLLRTRIEPTAHLDYRLVLPEPVSSGGKSADAADPKQYLSLGIVDHSFEQYVTQIDSFPDEYFDMVVVDGRARPSCVMHGVSKVKPGGLLILDNADREYYLEKTRSFLQDFHQIPYYGALPKVFYFERTDIYVKQTGSFSGENSL